MRPYDEYRSTRNEYQIELFQQQIVDNLVQILFKFFEQVHDSFNFTWK